jgi:hypothetical protein
MLDCPARIKTFTGRGGSDAKESVIGNAKMPMTIKPYRIANVASVNASPSDPKGLFYTALSKRIGHGGMGTSDLNLIQAWLGVMRS